MAANQKTPLLRQLFRLWGLYARLDFLMITSNPAMFFTWLVADSALSIGSVTGFLLLAERFGGIGIWNREQYLFLLGYAALVEGIVATLFGYNVSFISRRLGRGQLDHTLIQPQPLWLSLLTEGFNPIYGLPLMLPGIGLMVWALSRLHMAITLGWLLQLGMNLLASAAVLMAFQFLWGSLAFWAPRAAEEINSSTMRLMTQLKSYPLDSVGVALAGGMLIALPVGFIAWVPCRALLALERTGWGLWMTPLAALLFMLPAGWAFQRGLRHYAKTGAQRYSGWGHRS